MKLSDQLRWELDRLEAQIKFSRRVDMFQNAMRVVSVPVIIWAIYEVVMNLSK